MSTCPDNMDNSQPKESKKVVAQAMTSAAVTIDGPSNSIEQVFSLQDTAAEGAPSQSLATLLDSVEAASAADTYTGATKPPKEQPTPTADPASRGEVFNLPGAESSAATADVKDSLNIGVEPAAPATLSEEQGQSGHQAQDSTIATQPELNCDDSIEQALTRHRQLLERNQHLQHALSTVDPLSRLLQLWSLHPLLLLWAPSDPLLGSCLHCRFLQQREAQRVGRKALRTALLRPWTLTMGRSSTLPISRSGPGPRIAEQPWKPHSLPSLLSSRCSTLGLHSSISLTSGDLSGNFNVYAI